MPKTSMRNSKIQGGRVIKKEWIKQSPMIAKESSINMTLWALLVKYKVHSKACQSLNNPKSSMRTTYSKKRSGK